MKRGSGWKAGDVFMVPHVQRMKGAADGLGSLEAIAARLEALAVRLRKDHVEGWVLALPVQDDYINTIRQGHGVAITASEARLLNAGADVPDRLMAAECETCARPPRRQRVKTRRPL